MKKSTLFRYLSPQCPIFYAFSYRCYVGDLTGKKQMVFRADYDVECSSIVDAISQSSLQSVSNNNYKQIEEICQQGMCIEPSADLPFVRHAGVQEILMRLDFQSLNQL